ncbi:MAG: 23S rRNA (pseudouridine(1915)-N(3))-methyltransferase RlmH [Eubacterium sp.]|nr:23S rRNA (pseudouridine(1915)-N(3))-methyltransferase RlmH [Eubacterium sp.]
MKITIVSVGKMKEKYFVDAIDEYTKRLSKYCKLNFIEVKDEKTKENASSVEEDIIKETEGKRILDKISDSSKVIALAIEGKKFSSEELAKEIETLRVSGVSDLTFVIGGSLGLHKSVLDRADMLLSFSDMTFPHQLMRVILLEQIYRTFRIINNEPYHK